MLVPPATAIGDRFDDQTAVRFAGWRPPVGGTRSGVLMRVRSHPSAGRLVARWWAVVGNGDRTADERWWVGAVDQVRMALPVQFRSVEMQVFVDEPDVDGWRVLSEGTRGVSGGVLTQRTRYRLGVDGPADAGPAVAQTFEVEMRLGAAMQLLR